MSAHRQDSNDLLLSRDLRGSTVEHLREVTKALYERDSKTIFRFGLGYFHGDEDAASELVQSVFSQVVDKLSSFRGEAALSTWAMRIAIRTAWRQKQLVNRTTEQYEDTPDGSVDSAPDTAMKKERNAQVRQALSKISKEHQSILILFAVEGLSHQEAADALGIELGTAWSRFARARIALAEQLRAYESD